MACDCGAAKTYNAKPADNNHYSWCSDSKANYGKIRPIVQNVPVTAFRQVAGNLNTTFGPISKPSAWIGVSLPPSPADKYCHENGCKDIVAYGFYRSNSYKYSVVCCGKHYQKILNGVVAQKIGLGYKYNCVEIVAQNPVPNCVPWAAVPGPVQAPATQQVGAGVTIGVANGCQLPPHAVTTMVCGSPGCYIKPVYGFYRNGYWQAVACPNHYIDVVRDSLQKHIQNGLMFDCTVLQPTGAPDTSVPPWGVVASNGIGVVGIGGATNKHKCDNNTCGNNADLVITYPANFIGSYGSNVHAGKTKYWCSQCCSLTVRNGLIAKGCVVTDLP